MCAARHRLTNMEIDAARHKAKKGDTWLSDDDGSRGWGRLVIRIRPSGTPLFYFKHVVNGKVYRRPLGRYSKNICEGFLTLQEAQTIVRKAAAFLHPIRVGVPLHVPVAQQAEPQLTGSAQQPVPTFPSPSPAASTVSAKANDSVLDLCNEYAAHLLAKGKDRSGRCARSQINLHVRPAPIAARRACDVSTREAVTYLRDLSKQCSPYMVNRLRSILLTAYNVAIGSSVSAEAQVDLSRFEITINPFAQIKKVRARKNVRNRVLSPEELGHLWIELTTDAEAAKPKFQAIRLAILLGGQRCLQLLRALTADVNLGDKTILLYDPKGNREVPREHLLPLCPMAYAELSPIVQACRTDGRALVFQAKNRTTPLTEGQVSKAMASISRRMVECGYFEAAFGYADIRQTIETRMSDSKLNISKEVRAQIQSHDLGGVQIATYNRHDFLDHKWPALQRWEKHLMDCVKKAKAIRERSDA